MSLVMELTGQLNCHFFAVRLVKVDWWVLIRLLFRLVKLSVQYIVCLFWCR